MLKPKSVRRLLTTADATLARLLKMVAEERASQLKTVRRLQTYCSACKQSFPLHRWTFVQERDYTYPSGYDGGYWSDSDFEHCHVMCPRCSTLNRLDFRKDMVPLLEIQKQYRFVIANLFDPKIIVGTERDC